MNNYLNDLYEIQHFLTKEMPEQGSNLFKALAIVDNLIDAYHNFADELDSIDIEVDREQKRSKGLGDA